MIEREGSTAAEPRAVPAPPSRARPLAWTVVVCLYTALTLACFWPLPRLWQDHLGPDLGDPLFNLYVLKWDVRQIRLGLPDLWDANIFYPTRGAWRGRRDRGDPPRGVWARGLALSGLVCFALSLTVVYSKLLHAIPGLSGMRVPARFYAFVSVTLVYFAARGVDLLLRRLPGPRARAAVAAGLAVVLVVEMKPAAVDWPRVPREGEMPRVYAWIRDQPGVRAVVELPIFTDDREIPYLYAATVHWKPIANGYSGYFPESHRLLTESIPLLPGVVGLDLLRDLGISHVVVHVEPPLRIKDVRRWERRHGDEVEPVYAAEADGIFVYRLLAAPEPVGKGP